MGGFGIDTSPQYVYITAAGVGFRWGTGKENRLGHQRPEKLDLLLVAGGAEPASLAGEGEQVVFLASVLALRATPRQGGRSGCGRTPAPDRRSP